MSRGRRQWRRERARRSIDACGTERARVGKRRGCYRPEVAVNSSPARGGGPRSGGGVTPYREGDTPPSGLRPATSPCKGGWSGSDHLLPLALASGTSDSRHSLKQREQLMASEFTPGDVLAVTWDTREIRVIQADANETFYDVAWDQHGWGVERARTAIFYRMRTDYLKETSRILRSQPLSSKERDKLRPDLPMRFFRHQAADWLNREEDLAALEPDTELQARQLAIIPFGTKGGSLKAHRIVDDSGLTLRRLVKEARGLQQADCAEVSGVGIYRSGIVANIPSYYLWGAVDRAGHVP